MDFLLSDNDGTRAAAASVRTRCPLPILPSQDNLVRVDLEEPIEETGIYRDVWERKPLGDDDADRRTHCCMGDRIEYPTAADEEERSKDRAFARKEIVKERNRLKWAAEKAAKKAAKEQDALPAAPFEEVDRRGK